jgi:predicted transcriptional regulator of viral defense system
MLSAMQAIHEYEAAIKAFQECADRTANPFDKKVANAAIDRLVGIADKFNVELNAFKKKSAQ